MEKESEKSSELTPEAQAESSKLQFGYTVGVDESGKFVFDLHGGEKSGFVQLLGLTKFAEQQITQLMDAVLGQGFPLMNARLIAVQNKLDEVLKKLNTEQNG